jgi:amidophosphoribosyltransferase
MRISCPPHRYGCHYGIDFPDPKELLANRRTHKQNEAHLGVDSLEYLTLDGMVRATQQPRESFCMACFDGRYPTPIEDAVSGCAGKVPGAFAKPGGLLSNYTPHPELFPRQT